MENTAQQGYIENTRTKPADCARRAYQDCKGQEYLAWLRQIHCEALEIAKRAMGHGTLVGSTQDHPGSMVCLESFLPTGCAQAPAIAGFQARKA